MQCLAYTRIRTCRHEGKRDRVRQGVRDRELGDSLFLPVKGRAIVTGRVCKMVNHISKRCGVRTTLPERVVTGPLSCCGWAGGTRPEGLRSRGTEEWAGAELS